MMRSDNIVITLVFGSFYSFSGVNKRCNLVCVSAYDSIVSYEIEIYCKQRVIELQCVVYTFFLFFIVSASLLNKCVCIVRWCIQDGRWTFTST